MLLFLLGFVLVQTPATEIKLENQDRYLPNASFNRVFLSKNNTFLAMTTYQVWHWDSEGNLINRFGSKGEGPGEFQFVGQVLWDGTYYWVVDSRMLESSVFDNNGRFLFRHPLYFRQFVPVEDEIFVLDFSQLNQRRGNLPTTLQKIEYDVGEKAINVKLVNPRFKKVSERQREFQYNFKLVWVVREGNEYLVVDQLEPKIWRYSPETIARESKLTEMELFEPPYTPFQATRWEEPPKSMPASRKSDREFVVWWRSWSRINYFAKAGNDYMVAYEAPDPDSPAESFQVIQRIAKNGKAIGKSMALEGAIMGVRNNQVYIFKEADTEENFIYWVHAYDF